MEEPHRIHRRPRRRRFDAILDRLEQRRATPRLFPPDFPHGSFTPDQAYDARVDVESVAFVRVLGRHVCVAKFREHFLTIYAHELDDHAAARRWAHQLIEGMSEVVELSLDGEPEHGVTPTTRQLVLTFEELLATERELFGIVREQDALEEGLERAQNDVLTLIGLFTRAHLDEESPRPVFRRAA